MKPRISIIVPVYNVEKFLDKCILSLINQTYRSIEIILVDDGSTDNCPKICDYYSKKDSRIKVIHKKNGGLSDARNAGLQLAIGEYILFVDSDDYIELDTCERFIEAMGNERPDIVVGNAIKKDGTKKTIMKHKYITKGTLITGEEYLKQELKSRTMYMAAWLNLYRRDFLLTNNLMFKDGLLHEDEHFTPRCFLKAKKVLGTDIIFYNYLIRDNSITKKKDLSLNGVHIIQTCYELAETYSKIEDKELRRLLYNNLVTKYLYGFQIGKLYKKEYKNLIKKKFVWKHASSLRNFLKAILFITSKRAYYLINVVIKFK